MKKVLILAASCAFATVALAKLPPPSDEAKVKAAATAAKTAWSGKMAGYLLCKSQDKAAASYYKAAKAAGKEARAPGATPACADPGPFVYTPPVTGPAAVAAPATAPAAAAPKKS